MTKSNVLFTVLKREKPQVPMVVIENSVESLYLFVRRVKDDMTVHQY